MRFLPLSWGELSFSRELDRNHPYHHREHCLFGRKGMASGQKKTPQAKPEAIVLCTTRLCDCYHMDTSTRGVTPPEGSSQEEHGEGAEFPVCWPRVPGEAPTCSSQPRHHGSVGLPAFRAEQEQKLQSCSHSQDLFVCMHTALSLHHKLLQSASWKNRRLFNQIKDQSCI